MWPNWITQNKRVQDYQVYCTIQVTRFVHNTSYIFIYMYRLLFKKSKIIIKFYHKCLSSLWLLCLQAKYATKIFTQIFNNFFKAIQTFINYEKIMLIELKV